MREKCGWTIDGKQCAFGEVAEMRGRFRRAERTVGRNMLARNCALFQSRETVERGVERRGR